jgi:hypothetical protein
MSLWDGHIARGNMPHVGSPLLAALPLMLSLEDSDLAARRPGFAEITCSDQSAFRGWPDAELAKVIDLLARGYERVQAGTYTKARFKEIEQMVGFNFTPTGLLADVELRNLVHPVEAATYDWVHTLLSSGVLSIELSAFLSACEPHGVERATIRDWLADPSWIFPRASRAKCKQLCRVFDVHRESDKSPDSVRASCSEMLGLYGLLRHFVDVSVPRIPELAAQRASFDAVCTVLDEILSAKRSGVHDGVPAKISRAACRFLELHKEAYGTELIVPKHHWLLDVADQVHRDASVIDCFVIERQHLIIKNIATHIRNTQTFERSVLGGVCTSIGPDTESLTNGLVGHVAPLPGYFGVSVADKLRFLGLQVTLDDMVLWSGKVGSVVACAAEGDQYFVFVDTLQVVSPLSKQAHVYRADGGRELWPVTNLRLALAWYLKDDGDWVVLGV